MSSRRTPSSWLLAGGFIVVTWVFADVVVLKGPLYTLAMRGGAGEAAVEAAGITITRRELAEALRQDLWRRHETWAALDAATRSQRRHTVLEKLVNDRLVRAARLRDPAFHPATPSVRRELDMQQRQFAMPAQHPPRLAAQGHTPQSFQEAVRAAQLDEQWLQARIHLRVPPPGEASLRTWYEQRKETLRIPPAYHAAHLFLRGKDRSAELQQIRSQIVSKKHTFAALAARHSEDERTRNIGGDLGWFTRERMPADFIAAVAPLPVGRFSEPVSTRLGWHLLIVLERRESRLPGFDEVRDEIAALLHRQQSDAALQQLITALKTDAAPATKYHAEIIDRVEPAP